MKIRLNKVYEAEPMTRYQAEERMKHKINNLIHGDYGYWINNQWFPKDVIDSKSVPYDKDADIIKFIIQTLSEAPVEIINSLTNRPHREELINTINKLLKQINYEQQHD